MPADHHPMTPTTKPELLAALTENELESAREVLTLSGRLTDEDWLATLKRIIALRLVQKELEGKLTALIE